MGNKPTLKDKVKELMGQIDLSTVTVSPSLFSDDYDKYDCNECKNFEDTAGDLYDSDVCLDCWRNAIDSYQPE